MKDTGINTSVFKPHSTRAVSTATAQRAYVNINEIMKAAGWSNAATFAKYYNKPIIGNGLAHAQAIFS